MEAYTSSAREIDIPSAKRLYQKASPAISDKGDGSDL